MRVPRMSAGTFRRLTTANVAFLVAVVVSGAIVRVTNSGLGCHDWPNCSATQFVSVSTHHAAIEQINRILSGAIGVPLAFTVLGASVMTPRRADLVRLSWTLFGLFWFEAVLGGISVELKLAWVSVMGHFVLALALVGVALQIRQRAREGTGPRRAQVTPAASVLVRVVYVWTIGVVIAGTLVTAAGPHGGDQNTKRLSIPLTDLARVHGVSVDALVILALVTAVVLVRTHAPRTVLTTMSLAIAAMVAQGILGYVQYAEAVPALLVGFHVFGAVVVFAAVQQLQLVTHRPVPDARPIDPGGRLSEPASLMADGYRTSAATRDPVA
jgi:cytochrome c oxidase assembly protein subunit 15